MNSIRRRLLLSLLTGLLICTAMSIGVAYIDTTHELGELFSNNLRRIAVVLRGQAFPEITSTPMPSEFGHEELEESYVIQLWDTHGALLRSSDDDVKIPLQSHEGVTNLTIDGTDWQIYMLKAGPTGFVQVAQPQEIVATMIGESATRALLPLFALLFLLGIGAWYAVGRSLSPLAKLSQTISGWEADKLQSLSVDETPLEIQPVARAINGLLLKLNNAMSLQRRFTADAAHELRTPLTAIKLQLDILLRAQTEHEKHEAVSRLSEGINRCIHLAQQLLVASRISALQVNSGFQTIRLHELVRSSMATFGILASSKNIDISFEDDASCDINGNEEGLRVLTNNLIDNAIRYTPSGGEVRVRLQSVNGAVILVVEDNGPGIPKPEQERIFQRFYRLPGTGSTGSGLGLAIVKSVAENHRATIIVSEGTNKRGTMMSVLFPIERST